MAKFYTLCKSCKNEIIEVVLGEEPVCDDCLDDWVTNESNSQRELAHQQAANSATTQRVIGMLFLVLMGALLIHIDVPRASIVAMCGGLAFGLLVSTEYSIRHAMSKYDEDNS